jgi:hypothetical protein
MVVELIGEVGLAAFVDMHMVHRRSTLADGASRTNIFAGKKSAA